MSHKILFRQSISCSVLRLSYLSVNKLKPIAKREWNE